jgi:hypothetical protein
MYYFRQSPAIGIQQAGIIARYEEIADVRLLLGENFDLRSLTTPRHLPTIGPGDTEIRNA